MSQFSVEAFGEGPHSDALLALLAAAREYRDDPDFRARIEADPRGVLQQRDVKFEPDDIEVRLSVNTPEVFHLVLPMNPNTAVSDSMLGDVSGGSSASTAGTVGSAGTASTAPSCLGSAGSVSSAGSGGTASAQS